MGVGGLSGREMLPMWAREPFQTGRVPFGPLEPGGLLACLLVLSLPSFFERRACRGHSAGISPLCWSVTKVLSDGPALRLDPLLLSSVGSALIFSPLGAAREREVVRASRFAQREARS